MPHALCTQDVYQKLAQGTSIKNYRLDIAATSMGTYRYESDECEEEDYTLYTVHTVLVVPIP